MNRFPQSQPPTKASSIDLTLILPLYNEGDILSANLQTIFATLEGGGLAFEMLLIDDGSRDASRRTAEKFAEQHTDRVRVIAHAVNQGRGATVMHGLREARGTIAGFIDVDCEASPMYIPNMVRELRSGKADVIIGMRIYPFSFSTYFRAIMSVSYRWLVRLLFGVHVRDRQSGYKFFRRERILPVLPFVQSGGWFWDTEIIVVALAAKLRVLEMPVLFLRDTSKKSTVHIIRDSFRMLQQLVMLRFRLPALKRSIEQTLQR